LGQEAEVVHAGEIEGLLSTFSDYAHIRVADYQRNYDWSKAEILDLWRDLKQAISSDKDHFFGSLIVQETDKSSCELVDGQQRMTTVFLIAARLRDEVRLLPAQEIKAQSDSDRDIPVATVIEDFLYGRSTKSTKPRFQPNTLLQEVGHAAMSRLSDKDREKQIPRRSRDSDREATLPFRNAYWYIKDLVGSDLQNLSDEQKLEKIHTLAQGLLEKMKVLTITTSNHEESLDVFMTTNDRGLPLGVFDLTRGQVLKALTSGRTHAEQKEIFIQTLKDWDEILENVEGSKPDQFLRHHLLSSRSQKVTMKSVPTVTESIIGFENKDFASRAQDLWDALKLSSAVYDSILRPSMGTPTREHLEGMRLLADSYRVLALRVLHPESELTEEQRATLIRLLWVSVFRWNLAFGNAQDFESALQKAAQPLWASGGFGAAKKELEQLARTEFDLSRYLAEGVSVQAAKAILLAIETELSGKAASLNLSNLHLEHIAPQKPTPHWSESLGVAGSDYKDLVADIGNLTILDSGLNQSVKQDPFDAKKIEYKKSRSNISNDLALVKVWNSEQIARRRNWIAECMLNLLRDEPGRIVQFSEWSD
jgi:hypothetical protein